MKTNLEVRIGRLKLKNPLMLASGTFGWPEEFKDFVNLRKLGAIVTKTITLNPRPGNPPPRTCETPAGMLNSIGLENPGIDKFIKEKIPLLKNLDVPIVVSISSEDDPEGFIRLAKQLDKINAVAAVELNISCPNVKNPKSKMQNSKLISQDPKATYTVVEAVRKVTHKTLITKLSPNVTDIAEIAQAAERAGSDAVALINTIVGMGIDVESCQPKLAMITGGLSGPAIRPIAVRMCWEVYQKIKIPIIGMGGIIDTQSALEFFLAGATAVAVGTANFINPRTSEEIIEGIRSYLIKNKIEDIKAFIGSLQR